MAPHLFRYQLFLCGNTPYNQLATQNIKNFCELYLPHEYELQIVDVLQSPDVAEQHNILATPTLVQWSPAPQKRVLGDLNDSRYLALTLGIKTKPHNT